MSSLFKFFDPLNSLSPHRLGPHIVVRPVVTIHLSKVYENLVNAPHRAGQKRKRPRVVACATVSLGCLQYYSLSLPYYISNDPLFPLLPGVFVYLLLDSMFSDGHS